MPNLSSPRTVVPMHVYIAIGSARKFIVVANYLKLPLLSTRQPNYLKLPMRLTAFCAPPGAVLPERTGVSFSPRRSKIGQISQEFRRLKFDSRWKLRRDEIGRSRSAKGFTPGNLVADAFNSNRWGTLPHFAWSNVARVCHIGSLLKAWLSGNS